MTIPHSAKIWAEQSGPKPYTAEVGLELGETWTVSFSPGQAYAWYIFNSSSAADYFAVTITCSGGSSTFNLYQNQVESWQNGELPLKSISVTNYASGSGAVTFQFHAAVGGA